MFSFSLAIFTHSATIILWQSTCDKKYHSINIIELSRNVDSAIIVPRKKNCDRPRKRFSFCMGKKIANSAFDIIRRKKNDQNWLWKIALMSDIARSCLCLSLESFFCLWRESQVLKAKHITRLTITSNAFEKKTHFWGGFTSDNDVNVLWSLSVVDRCDPCWPHACMLTLTGMNVRHVYEWSVHSSRGVTYNNIGHCFTRVNIWRCFIFWSCCGVQ